MDQEQQYKKFLANNPYPRQLKSYDEFNLINFSSNDYLGLAKHPLLIARSQEYAARWGVGSTASRLVTGNLTIYESLEQQLATALNKPAALILGSGYQTNMSVLEALLDARVLGKIPLIFCDRYCHNSLLSLTQHLGTIHRFQHQDYEHLRRLLAKHTNTDQPKFILAESIYSMDGDQTDLAELVSIAEQYQAFLYVDDAHAIGVYGASGWGLAPDYANGVDIIMGTFSKALGSQGGYIACSTVMRDYLINKCRGLIYSTALSPAVLGAIAGALELMPQLEAARAQLMIKAERLREFMREHDLNVGSSNSHIIPWVIGDAEQALQVSALLREQGILATTIRPPTVPVGASRIRFCLSVLHSDENIEKLMNAILLVKQFLSQCHPE
jgi:8-amino-7-oxononanoate synthase